MSVTQIELDTYVLSVGKLKKASSFHLKKRILEGSLPFMFISTKPIILLEGLVFFKV